MHGFIKDIIIKNHGQENYTKITSNNLIKFINSKTKSYNKDAKSRANYGTLYAIYVVIEDYIEKGYSSMEKDYSLYEGANYTPLFAKMRSMPFGSKLQNHPLNNRVNSEFKKTYEESGNIIERDQEKQKYWINEKLLLIDGINISKTILEIIDKYIEIKKDNLSQFIEECKKLEKNNDIHEIMKFIKIHIAPNADARRFEIISFAILKNYYSEFSIWYGTSKENVNETELKLYKTGRTNANDGGIDFILLPKGEIFQVTETLDFTKYFLDIDKLNKFPISFVVKKEEDSDSVFEKIRQSAQKKYEDQSVLNKYMESINKIITIKNLNEYIDYVYKKNKITQVLDDIILESEVEYNFN
ncbi:restriction endonuclease [Staphylococcus hominis]|uniref:restriction endonuclease n=1 Tax=Staphylococcus hominis TaxID=1290 RepID=UPI000D1FD155|nr:restriction endonuclease [Staphylococcus hominis]PTK22192.1 restriction endonuclease [Staphylococcus hominis]RIO51355.1 restriction endonuclease [Staphylococcus hominis]